MSIKRRLLWETLTLIQTNHLLPWCMIGDFNTILGSHEQRSNFRPLTTPIHDFQTWTDTNNLIITSFLPAPPAISLLHKTKPTYKNNKTSIEGNSIPFTYKQEKSPTAGPDKTDMALTPHCNTLNP